MIIPGRKLVPVIRSALGRGQRVQLTVSGSSMRPFIDDGDTVEVRPVQGPLPVGSIVLAEFERDRYVVHRIVGRGSGTYLLRGDAQIHPDVRVAVGNVVGHVTRVCSPGRARALDSVTWQGAGLLWLYLNPVGPSVYRLAQAVLPGALGRLQRVRGFRKCLRGLAPHYTIQAADAKDADPKAESPARADDAPPPTKSGKNRRVTAFVAVRKHDQIGSVLLVQHSSADFPLVGYWTYSLIVRIRYRGMGIGEALTRRVIREAEAENAKELCLTVFEGNLSAISLYRKLGFERMILPSLEAALIEESEKTGRRRIAMKKVLG